MSEETKIELLEDVFDIDPGELTPETELASLDGFNSLSRLSLVVMIDEECGKTPTDSDIRGFVTIRDIMNYMG